MFCPQCGTRNDDNNYRCTNCSAVIQSPAAPAAPAAAAMPADATALGGLIPYKNSSALIAYYLGIFSLACGLLLGLPALIYGIKGIKFANLHPEVKGKAHAWIGIVLGSLTTLVSLAIIAIWAVAALQK